MKENDAMTNDNRSSIHSKVLDAPLPGPFRRYATAFMRKADIQACLQEGNVCKVFANRPG